MRTIVLVLALSGAAAADEVVMTHGGKIVGRAEIHGESVVVETQYGTVVLPQSRVARIDFTTTSPLQEYENRRRLADLSRLEDVEGLLRWAEGRRMAKAVRELRARRRPLLAATLNGAGHAEHEAVAARMRVEGDGVMAEWALRRALQIRRAAAKDTAALYRLALWAREHGLGADALVLFQEVIVREPNHEFARRALGYRRYNGEWLTEAEMNRAMGLVLHEGQWMTPGERTARKLERERLRVEDAQRRLAHDRARAEAEAAHRRSIQPVYDPGYSNRYDSRSTRYRYSYGNRGYCPPPPPPRCPPPTVRRTPKTYPGQRVMGTGTSRVTNSSRTSRR